MKSLIYLILAGILVYGAWKFLGSSDTPVSSGSLPEGAWLTDYASARLAAEGSNRPILINFTGSDWCGWCIKLKDEVFSTSEFLAYANSNLVLLEIDFPRSKAQAPALVEQNQTLQSKFGIRGYPTLIVLNPKGEKIGQLGYMPGGPSAFIQELKRVVSGI